MKTINKRVKNKKKSLVINLIYKKALTGLRITNNVQAKLMTIWRGMHVAWELGIKKLIIESDSKFSLELIHKESEDSPYLNIIVMIKELRSHSWELQFKH